MIPSNVSMLFVQTQAKLHKVPAHGNVQVLPQGTSSCKQAVQAAAAALGVLLLHCGSSKNNFIRCTNIGGVVCCCCCCCTMPCLLQEAAGTLLEDVIGTAFFQLDPVM